MRTLFLAICLSALPGLAAADTYTFMVPPAETVSSPVGLSLTGWGYSLHNESSSLWLVTTGLSAGTFQYATPDLIFDFPDLAPGATATVPYNPLKPAGLYQIVWDANAPSGFVNSGTFSLTAEWWNGDPVAGGSFVGAAPSASQPYATAVTPEPETAGVVALSGLLLVAIRAFRRRRIASLADVAIPL